MNYNQIFAAIETELKIVGIHDNPRLGSPPIYIELLGKLGADAKIIKNLELFNTRIKQGYPYDYTNNGQFSHLWTIVRLFVIKSAQVFKFIYNYLISYNFKDNERAVYQLLYTAFRHCIYESHFPPLKFILDTFVKVGVKLDYVYFHILRNIYETTDYLYNIEYKQLLEFGLSYGLRIDQEIIESIANMRRTIVFNTNVNDGKSSCIIPFLDSVHKLKDKKLKPNQVSAFAKKIVTEHLDRVNTLYNIKSMIPPYELISQLCSSLKRYRVGDVPIEHIIDEMSYYNVNIIDVSDIKYYDTVKNIDKLNMVATYVDNVKQTYPHIEIEDLKFMITRLSIIWLTIPLDGGKYYYLYKSLGNKAQIKNYNEWQQLSEAMESITKRGILSTISIDEAGIKQCIYLIRGKYIKAKSYIKSISNIETKNTLTNDELVIMT